MTYKEAYDDITYVHYGFSKDLHKVLVDALEKQIPREVDLFTETCKLQDGHYRQFFYPKCPNWLNADCHDIKAEPYFSSLDRRDKYCSVCGQALDWSLYDEKIERKKAEFDEKKLIENIKKSGGEK